MWTLSKYLLVGAITLFWFQNTSPNPGETANVAATAVPAKTAANTTATIAPSQPVITVHGICEEDTGKIKADASSCATVITRERFENLAHALHPGQDLPTNARNNLAKLYAEYMSVEAAAHKAGMEDTAEYHEFMNWMRVLAATEYYRRKLQQKYSTPSQEEIHAYYQQHLAEYEKAKLERVLIPRENGSVANKDEFDKKALEAANTAHASLAQGVNAMEVQKEVYATLGLQTPPAVDLGSQRRKDFLGEEAAEVFSLKPGGITKVQTEPKSYVIYKILALETVPEEDVKKFISSQITEKEFREAMNTVVNAATVDLNEQYFGTPSSTPEEPPRSPHTMSSH